MAVGNVGSTFGQSSRQRASALIVVPALRSTAASEFDEISLQLTIFRILSLVWNDLMSFSLSGGFRSFVCW